MAAKTSRISDGHDLIEDGRSRLKTVSVTGSAAGAVRRRVGAIEVKELTVSDLDHWITRSHRRDGQSAWSRYQIR
jgi:hypothetical protein